MEMERRHLGIGAAELRVEGDDAPRLVGYASMFGNWYPVGGFRERIAPGAFGDVVGGDVVALFNHDPDHVLGRSGGTLTLVEDDTGLHYDVALGQTTIARDVRENVRLGNVRGSSFSFSVGDGGDTWEQRDGVPHRTITRMSGLFDVGPVTFPANQNTVVAARSLELARAEVVAPVDVLGIYKERQRLAEAI